LLGRPSASDCVIEEKRQRTPIGRVLRGISKKKKKEESFLREKLPGGRATHWKKKYRMGNGGKADRL